MNKHYFVLKTHQWGASSNLIEAVHNCQIDMGGIAQQLEAVTYYDSDMSLSDLQESIDDYRYEPEPEKFAVIITDADRWKFTGASPFDGRPYYEWIGEGDEPEQIEQIEVILETDDGKLKVVES